jgi:hypothetical protein
MQLLPKCLHLCLQIVYALLKDFNRCFNHNGERQAAADKQHDSQTCQA